MTIGLGLLLCLLAVGIYCFFYYGRKWASRGPREWLRRHDNGLCVHCGYDKQSDPRGRCPECGRF
jgi:hypothetical protein